MNLFPFRSLDEKLKLPPPQKKNKNIFGIIIKAHRFSAQFNKSRTEQDL